MKKEEKPMSIEKDDKGKSKTTKLVASTKVVADVKGELPPDKPRVSVGVGKRRVMTSYKNLKPEILALLNEKYPFNSWSEHVTKAYGKDGFYYTVLLDTDDVTYLIKVDVEIDNLDKLEDERDLYGDDDMVDTPGADEIAVGDDED